MKRSRAFVLTELLTGMALQAGFLLVMCTAFYMMLSFYTRTQQVLTARERGQRVIAYFDTSIRHAGLGLWKCTSSRDINNSLSSISQLEGINFPVALTSDYTDTTITNSLGHKTYCGNILTLLYAERNIASSNILNLVVVNNNYQSADIVATPTAFRLINNGHKFRDSDFYHYVNSQMSPRVIYKYGSVQRFAVMTTSGVPFLLQCDVNNGNSYKFNVYKAGTSTISAKINPMDELLYLKCKRLFVESENFKYIDFTDDWGKKTPHEKGILEIYMELDTVTKIFDLYVLSTGGEDNSTERSKPENWPDNARWKDEYLKQSIYISHASWKMHNLENIAL